MNTPTIHAGTDNQNAPGAILERRFTSEEAISRLLAHSAVFFSRLEWEPVQDAVNFNLSDEDAEESTTQAQVGAETGQTSGEVDIAGYGAHTASSGGVSISGGISAAKGSTVSVVSSDPAVTQAALEYGADEDIAGDAAAVAETQAALQSNSAATSAALQSNTVVSTAAINANTNLSNAVIDANTADAEGAEQVAGESIAAISQNSSNDLAFAQTALQDNEEAQDTQTGALETESAEYAAGLAQATYNGQVEANNATTGQNQAINTSPIPTVADEQQSRLSTVGWWVTIVAGLIGIVWYLRKGKSP